MIKETNSENSAADYNFSYVDPLYCDYNATSPMSRTLIDFSSQAHMKNWFNPSSNYDSAYENSKLLEKTLNTLKKFLVGKPAASVITGSATEAVNQLLYSIKLQNFENVAFWVGESEHSAVKKSVEKYFGKVSSISTLDLITKNFAFASDFDQTKKNIIFIQAVNNETGVLNPIAELRAAVGDEAIILLDASQSFGKATDFVEQFQFVDALVISPHKFYGPKGLGVLVCSTDFIELSPLVVGGPQQNGMRAGTENMPQIALFYKWLSTLPTLINDYSKVELFRNEFEKSVLAKIPGSYALGADTERVSNTCTLFLPNALSDELVTALDAKGIMVSSGSACNSGTTDPSKSFLAMGLSWSDARCVIRFSFGLGNLAISPVELAETVVSTINEVN